MTRSRSVRAAAAVTLVLALAGCGASPPETFDLTAPSSTRQALAKSTLLVAEPTALQTLESDRIIVRSADGSISGVPGAQWSDRLPRLLQTRLVQSFEAAGRAVGRTGAGIAGDRILQWDLRFFGIATDGATQAQIEISAKVVDAASGRVAAARIFRASAPVASVTARAAVPALDQATQRIFADIVRWAGGRG